eukprot:191082_1
MSIPTYKTVKVSVSNKVALVVLNRPHKLNAFSNQLQDDFNEACKWVNSNNDINVLVITGAGRFFSAGVDQNNFNPENIEKYKKETERRQNTPKSKRKWGDGFGATLYYMNKPIIAAINGPTYGMAFSMLSFVDIIYASDTATFSAPFLKRGLSPECLSSYTFEQIMGKSKANEVLMMNKILSAKEAERYNFVSEVFSKDKLLDIVMNKAKKLANEIPMSGLKGFKQLRRQYMNEIYEDVHESEDKLLRKLITSPEAIAIAKSFVNRKKNKKTKSKL